MEKNEKERETDTHLPISGSVPRGRRNCWKVERERERGREESVQVEQRFPIGLK